MLVVKFDSLELENDYANSTDTTDQWISDMPSLRLLLLVLAGLGMIVYGFWRLIFSLRQVKEFTRRDKSK